MTQRDAKGRFLPGNKVAVGRATRQTERAYLAILSEECPPDTWRAICHSAVSFALAGDSRAREWVSNYLIGRPPLVVELSATDGTLLRNVLALLGERGISASALFETMLYQLSQEHEESDNV